MYMVEKIDNNMTWIFRPFRDSNPRPTTSTQRLALRDRPPSRLSYPPGHVYISIHFRKCDMFANNTEIKCC